MSIAERFPRLRDTHQSGIDVGAILRALPATARWQGLWVQYTGDGTDRARHNEVVVSVQYGWPGAAYAVDGKGRTVKEATDALIAELTREAHDGE